jgi:hypothetical protein
MSTRINLAATGLMASAALALAPAAHATESGASLYLLGSGGPDAAVLPPVEGVFFANTVWGYQGDLGAQRELPLGGVIAAGVEMKVVGDFPTVLWVPSTDVAGGTLALGLTVPFGYVDVAADAELTGPGGTPVRLSVGDDHWVFGDPVLMGSLGWTYGKTYIATTTMVNIPAGGYRDGELANLAFNRWAADISLALSWHDADSGWDVSGKAGYTVNGENEDTNYDSGNEIHLEGSVSKALNPKWTLGAQAYYLNQVSGDSGDGARLGAFKGEVTAVGGFAAYNFTIGEKPATLRLRAFHEFDARNRPEGDSVWLDFSLPFVMQLPPGAGGP